MGCGLRLPQRHVDHRLHRHDRRRIVHVRGPRVPGRDDEHRGSAQPERRLHGQVLRAVRRPAEPRLGFAHGADPVASDTAGDAHADALRHGHRSRITRTRGVLRDDDHARHGRSLPRR
ncbi:hypothetical protein MICRO8M_60216 [Microbacterium sp. 8M]|nr:hypothetical protein MICRO8M_60216 [Microbacterium sp. 8M]